MLLTEEEAKTKWCPLVRLTPVETRGFIVTNRTDSTKDLEGDGCGGASRCIGSACMAWRVAGQKEEKFFVPGPTEEERAAAAEKGCAWPEAHWASRPIPTGYCGLAGKAEP